jgi:hypothetical protein
MSEEKQTFLRSDVAEKVDAIVAKLDELAKELQIDAGTLQVAGMMKLARKISMGMTKSQWHDKCSKLFSLYDIWRNREKTS